MTFTYIINVVIINFDATSFNVTEPGIVQVGIIASGNITFDVIITIEVVFETATGKWFIPLKHVTKFHNIFY